METLQWDQPIHAHEGTFTRIKSAGWSRSKPKNGTLPRNYFQLTIEVENAGYKKDCSRKWFYNTEEERQAFQPLLDAFGLGALMQMAAPMPYVIKHTTNDAGNVYDNIYINFAQDHPANAVRSSKALGAAQAPAPVAPPAVAPQAVPVMPPQQPLLESVLETDDIPF